LSHRLRFVNIAVVVLLRLIWSPSSSAQSIDEVLVGISKNVKQFQELLPDFVCNEKITSTQFDSGRVIKQKIVESIFTGVQQSSEEKQIRFSFTESREVLSIDGRAVPKGTQLPKLPYRLSGGFGSLLITTFAAENLEFHNYSIGDSIKSENTNALLVRFSTKEGQQKLRSVVQGTRFFSKDVGAAWIDRTSFEVIRLQRQSLNLPSDLTRSTTTVDYGPVSIDERTFWIPMRIRAEVTERDTRAAASYVAEYSDCKRFTADIRLLQ
jgi:hypothetical protein